MDLGQRIKECRTSLGMTQEELALKLGYKSKSTINKIELGVNDITQSKVVQFADALNTTPAYLMGWESNPEETSKKIDVATDILIRMEKDKDFSDLVKHLYELDTAKISAVKTLLNSFLE